MASIRASPKRCEASASAKPGYDRPAIETLMAYLGTLRDGIGQPIDGPALDTIAALLERAEIEQHGALGRGDPLHAKGSKRKPGTGADHDAPDDQQTQAAKI
jgi:hypothetical protein